MPHRTIDLPLVLKALAYATEKHRGQTRKDADATPYIYHPIALASVLWTEAGIHDAEVLAAAILHDTIEDTTTTYDDLEEMIGKAVADIVGEVTDDKSLPKAERKRRQVEHARHLPYKARLVKLADKICNLRDIVATPPEGWSLERMHEYFEWAEKVVSPIRGADATLARLFDEAYSRKPGEPT
jgi:guanosine-3',5'-bis(diphosphate) 3'-pyrophosphohydrolase